MLDKHEETEEMPESTESGCFLSCFRNLLEGSDLATTFRELMAELLSNVNTEDKVVHDSVSQRTSSNEYKPVFTCKNEWVKVVRV